MRILEIKNLSVKTKQNGKKILENNCFEVEQGSIHVLIGPNGSGKSTLAKVLMGLPGFDVISGEIILKGKDISGLTVQERVKKGMALAWQEPIFFEGVSVEEFLRVGNKEISQKETAQVLFLVGLDPGRFLDRAIDKTLSGGERKRIELASIIAMRPELMILDEPDSGLDIIIYRELYNVLENIKKETKTSILLVTHREELGVIADKATFLNEGKTVCSGDFRGVMREYCRTVKRKKICSICPRNL